MLFNVPISFTDLQYFKNIELIYAQDSKQVSKVGDIVLLEKLPEKITTLIQHTVKEVVYPLGDITDPVTGKKVVGDKYRLVNHIKFSANPLKVISSFCKVQTMNNLILLCKARHTCYVMYTCTIKPLCPGFQTIACMPDVTGEVCGRTIERIVSVLSTGTVLLTRAFVWLIECLHKY